MCGTYIEYETNPVLRNRHEAELQISQILIAYQCHIHILFILQIQNVYNLHNKFTIPG